MGLPGPAAIALLPILLLQACAGGTPAGGGTPVVVGPPTTAANSLRAPPACATNATTIRDQAAVQAMDRAVDWIRVNTNFRELSRPCYLWTPAAELARRAGPSPAPEDSQLRVAAVYNCGERFIYLRDDLGLHLHLELVQSVLVHVLVHHAQCLHGHIPRMPVCELEQQAYAIQSSFLREQTGKAMIAPALQAVMNREADRMSALGARICDSRPQRS